MFRYPICGAIIISVVCYLRVCEFVCVHCHFLRVFQTRNADLFVPLLTFSGLERAFSLISF